MGQKPTWQGRQPDAKSNVAGKAEAEVKVVAKKDETGDGSISKNKDAPKQKGHGRKSKAD